MPGLPRRPISVVNSRATCRPAIEVSGIAAKHSRVTIVDDVQDVEAPPTGELVMYEIQRPASIRFDEDWRPRPYRAAPRTPLAHREFFLAIEPVDAVDARQLPALPQQHKQLPIAEALALIRQIAQCVRRAVSGGRVDR